MQIYSALLQIPGMQAPEMTFGEQMVDAWDGMGFMRYPLVLCLIIGLVVIVWKFFDLLAKSARTKKVLNQVNELLSQQKVDQAAEVCRASNSRPRKSSMPALSGGGREAIGS
jgi:hypothetical protein